MIKIGGLQKITLIDYPLKIGATVFLVGCNFECPWCYAKELVLEKKNKLNLISEEEFFNFLKDRKKLIEGVVVCGGEPTVNKKLIDFCQKIKKMGYFVKIDTNGSNPETLKKLIAKNLVDYFAMDIKNSLEDKKYQKATGRKIDLSKIKKSISIIKNSGIDYEFRITVVPGIHTKKDIVDLARQLSPAKNFYLQNFRPDKTINTKFEKVKPYPQKYLLEIQKAISPFFENCKIR